MNAIRRARRYLIEQLEDYTARLNDDIVRQLLAVESGNMYAINQAIKDGADDTKRGAYIVAANKDLHKLAQTVAPEELDNLAKKHEDGTLKAEDENNLFGHLADAVDKAVENGPRYNSGSK